MHLSLLDLRTPLDAVSCGRNWCRRKEGEKMELESGLLLFLSVGQVEKGRMGRMHELVSLSLPQLTGTSGQVWKVIYSQCLSDQH
jgi:hypothetical protein